MVIPASNQLSPEILSRLSELVRPSGVMCADCVARGDMDELLAWDEWLEGVFRQEPQSVGQMISGFYTDEAYVWFRGFRARASLLIAADLMVLGQHADPEFVGSPILEHRSSSSLFAFFAIAVAECMAEHQPAWTIPWFWREVFVVFPDLVDIECKENRAGILPHELENYYLDELSSYSGYEEIDNSILAQIQIKSACETYHPGQEFVRDLLVEAFSKIETLDHILSYRQEGDPDLMLFDQLSDLEKAIQELPSIPSADKEQWVSNLSDAFLSKAPAAQFDSYHPVSRIWFVAVRTWFVDDPGVLKDWLAECGERIPKENLAKILEIYSREQYPWLESYMDLYEDSIANAIPPERPRYSYTPEQWRQGAPETVYLDGFPVEKRERLLDFWALQKDKSDSDLYDLVVDKDRLIQERYDEYGEILELSHDVREEKPYTYGASVEIQERPFKAFASAVTSDSFEEEMSRYLPAEYPSYVMKCLPHVKPEKQVALLDKCLGKLRSRLRNDEEPFKIGEYAEVLLALVSAGGTGKVLKSLVLANKAAASCGNGDAVRVHRGLSEDAVQQHENHEIALNLYMAKWLPEQALGLGAEEVGGERYRSDAREAAKVRQMQILIKTLSEFCLSSLLLKKGQKAKDSGYIPKQCKEPDAHWRRAMLRALAELRLDVGGEAHEVAYFVHKHDFDTETREIAKEVHRDLRLFKPYKNSRDLHRAYLAALWQLRMGKAYAADVDIDLDLAKRWKTRELQRVK